MVSRKVSCMSPTSKHRQAVKRQCRNSFQDLSARWSQHNSCVCELVIWLTSLRPNPTSMVQLHYSMRCRTTAWTEQTGNTPVLKLIPLPHKLRPFDHTFEAASANSNEKLRTMLLPSCTPSTCIWARSHFCHSSEPKVTSTEGSTRILWKHGSKNQCASESCGGSSMLG